ncbi:hypothetical protein C7H19_23185 [Aphanothece hegewaldii CCALA 016]|uniref:DUF5615 domain-containing protein n=1 Tax=Aphanothece hegewaldii CCALA 016 TaxID=2107694 RepID=A0A2T1LRE6_9CHRO|nr:DUF5615 family PIN-like protein [Aphanothece hegewaldii]PSF31166.1 hypothetical protein C7H19_23185 [Aphanothece hegewaldii CCALA 016]
MKIVADANTQSYIVKQLRSDGHDLIWIVEIAPSISDQQVLAIANDNQALLLTNDKDFGEMVFREKLSSYYGIILLRLDGLTTEQKCLIVSSFIKNNENKLANTFTVITPTNIRTQKLSE